MRRSLSRGLGVGLCHRGAAGGGGGGNGLLNGLAFYTKMLSEAVAVGPGPLVNSGGVTFAASGPVAGEGAAELHLNAVDALTLDPTSAFQFGDQDVLVACWLQATVASASNWQEQVYTIGGANDGFILDINTIQGNGNQQILFGIPGNDAGYNGFAHGDDFPDSGWHLILGWYDHAALKVYAQLDGNAPVSADTVAAGAATDNPLIIGQQAGGWKHGPLGIWKGTIPGSAGRAALAAGTGYDQFTN